MRFDEIGDKARHARVREAHGFRLSIGQFIAASTATRSFLDGNGHVAGNGRFAMDRKRWESSKLRGHGDRTWEEKEKK